MKNERPVAHETNGLTGSELRRATGGVHRLAESERRSSVTKVRRLMASLAVGIDRCLHSTRFLRNENPPETRPLNYLRNGWPGRPNTRARRTTARLQPAREEGSEFEVKVRELMEVEQE